MGVSRFIGASGFQVDVLAGRLFGRRLIGRAVLGGIAGFLLAAALLLITVFIPNPQAIVVGFAGVFHFRDMMLELFFKFLGVTRAGIGLLVARAGDLALLHRALADAACDARPD